MPMHIFIQSFHLGLAHLREGAKGIVALLYVQGHQPNCAGEAWRAPWIPLDKKNPVVVFNMQSLGQLRDLWLSPRALMENKQSGPFLSKVNWTKQNMKKTQMKTP